MFKPVETPVLSRASPAEREMRAAVAERLRLLMPDARIVHELVCGERRADLAAVQPERITLIELKSERDKLDRCEGQMDTFCKVGHRAILVAHERWFDRTPYNTGHERCTWPGENSHRYTVWHYPEPPQDNPTVASWYRWKIEPPCLAQPPARFLLGLLWAAELRHDVRYTASMQASGLSSNG